MAEDLNWAVGARPATVSTPRVKSSLRPFPEPDGTYSRRKTSRPGSAAGTLPTKIRTSVESVQSVVDRLDILVALTQRTIDENLDELHEGSAIIYDGERSWEAEIPDEMTAVDVPLKTLAEEAGGAIMRNIVALGAACEITGFDVEYLDEALEKRFGGKGSKIVENNKAAARAGQEYVQENYDLQNTSATTSTRPTTTTSYSTATRRSAWVQSLPAAAGSTPAIRSRPRRRSWSI